MKLGKYFVLAEMTKSQTAARKGINNTPNEEQIENLKCLVENVLDPVREHFGKPVMVTSGYRSPELCAAIGSKPTSQHSKGEAADFEIHGMDNFDLAKWISKNIKFDQLILEFYTPGDPNSGWVHCSYKKDSSANRGQILTALNQGGRTTYQPGFPV